MKAIAAAFVKAQREFAPALKTNTNPHFRSKYVGLDGCVEAVIDALNNNGIALIQKCHDCEHGVKVETFFVHESGEELSGGILHVPASKLDAQGYGSALTYARRYSLMSACGIAPEDDDGNAASRTKPESAKSVSRSVWDGLPADEQNFLTAIAMEIIAAITLNDLPTAYAKFYMNNLDADEQTALWSRLDSKQRAAIKSYKESLKEAA